MAGGNPDVKLLFGAAEGSYDQINNDIVKIIERINKKPLGIKLTVKSTGNKGEWTKQINAALKTVNEGNKFAVSISNIKISSGAISGFKKQLESVINTIALDKGVSITLSPKGIGDIKKEVGDAAPKLTEAQRAAGELARQMSLLDSAAAPIKETFRSLKKFNFSDNELNKIAEIRTEYDAWLAKVKEIRATKQAVSQETQEQLTAEARGIYEKLSAIESERLATEETAKARKKLNELLKQASTALGYTNAKGTVQYKDIKENIYPQLQAMVSGGQPLNLSALDDLSAKLQENIAQIKAAGLASKSFFGTIISNVKKFSKWFGSTRIVMKIIQTIGKMIAAVKSIDVAMTELKKVTDETDEAYEKFLENASTRAKRLGAALSDVVSASADFARLGYSLDESSQLADAAIVYKNVGDGIENVSEATQSIISTMKAFGVEAEDSMSIVDKFNEVGNNFAISSKGIGDALLRSASALAAGNNTLEESIALVTAANSTVQDTDKVGTAMKSVSMFLRAAKTEAEEAGESTEGMANSVSELRGQILSLTSGKVDIQLDNDTFKSTYQILKELSVVWEELTDVTQANILEMIGGKRNSNVVMSLIENFQTAEEVMVSAADASGSALAENEKYLESIAGKISVFKAAFEEMSTSVISTTLVKGVVDLGTALVNVVNALAKINILFPAIIASYILWKSYKAADAVNSLVTASTTLLDAKNKEINAESTAHLSAAYSVLTKEQQKNVIATLTQMAAQDGLSKEEKERILGLASLISTTETATGATNRFSIALKGLSAVSTVSWIFLAISLLPMLIGLFDKLHKSNEELIQDAEELESSFESGLSGTTDDLKTLRGLKKEFETLSQGVDTYGNNISLAADDYDRYREIVSTILGISPSLISGYDKEGNAIANKNGLLEESIRLMEEERRLRIQEHVSGENLNTLGNGVVAEIQEVGKKSVIDTNILYSKLGASIQQFADNGDLFSIFAPSTNADDIDALREKYGPHIASFTQDYYQEIAELIRNGHTALVEYFSQEEIDELLGIVDEIEYVVNKAGEEKLKLSKSLNPTLQLIPQTLTSYSDLSDAQKQALTNYINTFRITADTTESDIENMKKDILGFTDFIAENEKLAEPIEIGIALKAGTAVDGRALSIEEYREQKNELQKTLSTLSEDEQVKIRAALELDNSGNFIDGVIDEAIKHADKIIVGMLPDDISLKEVMQIYYNISASPNSMTLEEARDILYELNGGELGENNRGLEALTSKIFDPLKQLSEIYSDVKDGDLFNYSSIFNNEDFRTMFSSLDSYEEFRAIIASYPNDISKCQIAFNTLTAELIEQSGALNGVTESNKNAAISMLRANGVANAQEIISSHLTYNQKRLELSTQAGTVAREAEIESMLEKCEVATLEHQILSGLLLEENLLNATEIKTGADVDNLLELAKAAGATLETIERLNEAKALASRIEIYEGIANTSISELARQKSTEESLRLSKELSNLLSSPIDLIEYDFNNVAVDFGGIPDSAKDATQKIKDAFDEMLADIEHEIQMLQFQGADFNIIVAKYEKMQELVHAQANKYRAMGLDENNDYIQELQRQWWEYEEAKYEIRQQYFDDYLNDRRFSVDQMLLDGASASDIGHVYSELFKAIDDEINFYLSKGFDTTDEIVQKLIEEGNNLKEESIDSIGRIVAEASDAVDKLQDVYNTLTDAATEYAEYGYITIDSLQSIIDLGVEYLAFLQDENGQLVINKDNIEKVISARAEQLAVESALSYVEQLRLTLEAEDTKKLEDLLDATTNTTEATWGLVYANLALLNLSGSQYSKALNNINNLRALATGATANISASLSGSTESQSDILDEQKSALEDILDYTMELIEWESEQQVEALEEQISDYEEMIELKKEMLRATKEEADYEGEVADKVKEIAKLQARIDVLSLDDSREAQAEKIALQEEMAGLQEELTDYQADHMIEKQEEALDDMAEAYREEKELEIKEVEKAVSSTEKIYQMAIDRINDDWDGLYSDLLVYNREYGNTIQSDLVSAWEAASAAVQKYGSYVNAVGGVDADIESLDNGNSNMLTGSFSGATVTVSSVQSIIQAMKANSAAWLATTDENARGKLADDNNKYASQLEKILNATLDRNNSGEWIIDGKKLYNLTASEIESYLKYHTGGIVGNNPTLKQNEVMAILENGEAVLDARREKGLFRLVDFVTAISDKFSKLISNVGYDHILQMRDTVKAGEPTAITDNNQTSVQFGDVYIYGSNDETVEKHREVNRQFVNDVLKQLNIKR